MRVRIFGLKKEQVNKYIKDIKWNFHSDKISLEHELQKVVNENEKLQIKLLPESKEDLEDTFWEFGNERIKEFMNQLNKQHELEKAVFRNDYAMKIEDVTKKINELDKEIEVANSLFSTMLDQITKIVEQSVYQLINGKTTINEEKQDNLSFKEEIGKINTSRVTKYQKETTTDKDCPANSLGSNMEGTSQQSNKKHNRFWAEVEEWAGESLNDIEENDLLTGLENEVVPQKFKDQDKSIKPMLKHDNKPTRALPNVDTSLIEQIDAIKSQYIVGKVAGEDLYDQAGNLIIAKSTKITREVVEEANRLGKLAELIVNMKLS